MGNIGADPKEIEFEPIPDSVPAVEPAPVSEPVPEEVPA
jgi:hypothetical protein